MDWNQLLDRTVAVAAMLVSIRPLMQGLLGSGGSLSWKRVLVMVVGGLFGFLGAVGLLVTKRIVLGEGEFFMPSWLGGTLAFFGGALGVSTLLSRRGPAC